MAMAMALASRGWTYGHNFLHLVFPKAVHDEASWGTRLHLPMQFLNGAVARAARVGAQVLGDAPMKKQVKKPAGKKSPSKKKAARVRDEI